MRQNQRKSHESMSVWITWLAVFHHYGHQYLINQCSWCLLGICRRKDSDHGTSQCISRGMEILQYLDWHQQQKEVDYIEPFFWSFWGSKRSWLLELIHVNQQQKINWHDQCFDASGGVNKVSTCQMTCFLFLILGDYPYKAAATNQWTWWISWWFRSVVNKLSMSNW